MITSKYSIRFKLFLACSISIISFVFMIGCGNNDAAALPATEAATENNDLYPTSELASIENEATEVLSPATEEASPATESINIDSLDDNEENKDVEDAQSAKLEDDPYAVFEVSEEWIQDNCRSGEMNARPGFVVERYGRLYNFSTFMPADNVDKYGIGYQNGVDYIDMRTPVNAYLFENKPLEGSSAYYNSEYISAGDFPAFALSRNEEVRVYDSNGFINDGDLYVKKASFVGNTIEVFKFEEGRAHPVINNVPDGDSQSRIDTYHMTDAGIFDMNDNPVENYRDLNYGDNYKFEWFNGTEYHELVYPATCRCYHVEEKEQKIQLPTKKTKNGYLSADMSLLLKSQNRESYNTFSK